ncbi:hypothetical protein QNJ95_37320 [Bradyrhizobium elkanii]|uniref:hypothetical protein n=1 Tax=Bradyrhizobium elkanii TaxID=29448 RepID=UPI002711EF81|nr:hypothetical protein [Bradyrhizobium elkanii]WLA38540.1 hypothetical protein QNJ95_37320 [Bradyrhizobium elkanii]
MTATLNAPLKAEPEDQIEIDLTRLSDGKMRVVISATVVSTNRAENAVLVDAVRDDLNSALQLVTFAANRAIG